MTHTWNDFMNVCKDEGHSWKSVGACLNMTKKEMTEWALSDSVPAEAIETVKAAELKNCLKRMDQLASFFYKEAVKIGNHPFIEFTGLMTEYIKVCANAAERGIDFRNSSKHSEQGPLQLQSFQVAYVQEKLSCIYGEQVLRHPDIKSSSIQPSPLTEEEMAIWNTEE